LLLINHREKFKLYQPDDQLFVDVGDAALDNIGRLFAADNQVRVREAAKLIVAFGPDNLVNNVADFEARMRKLGAYVEVK
jgi:hypothetical protein